jgi:uncharacterized membrane protein YcaP (DUF421 family)
MGKRAIGELDVFELVTSLLISELASIPIGDPDIPLLNAIIPILVIVSLEILIALIKNKSERLKRIFEGSPTFVIYKGKLIQRSLLDNRISMNEFLSEMRCQGIGSIKDVDYGIIEQNGALSFIKHGGGEFAHPLVIDGEYIKSDAHPEGKVKAIIKKRGLVLSDVFLMTVDDGGKIDIIIKEEK